MRYQYIILNTLVSLIAFGRNVLFMRTLEIDSLAQVGIMQTIVMLVGFVQIGTINGAYILFAEQNAQQTQRIVNVLSIGVVCLLLLATMAMLLGGAEFFVPLIVPETLIIGIFAGLCTLASTWMNNLLIAKGALGASNLINMAAVTTSLTLALFSASYGLSAALASILLQPLLVALGAMTVDRTTRPTFTYPDLTTLKDILQLGHMPFLGMLTVLVAYQVERWAIILALGPDAIGQFYLVMMFMNFFVIVPAALMNVHFPRAIRSLHDAQLDQFKAIRRRHGLELLGYGVLALAATFAFLPFVVKAILPQYESSIRLVNLVFPALLIFALRDNASIVLYSMKKTRPVFISGLVMVGVYSALLGGALGLGLMSLEAVVILRAVAAAISTAVLFKSASDELRVVTEEKPF
ncbi:hypothetical protein XMV208_000635 [Aliiroseovarius sp. xm-v-208]|nr:hypothetical protein [Aliiroseovarius sp. xm-v-208]